MVTCGSIYLILQTSSNHLRLEPFLHLGLGIRTTPEATLVWSGVLRKRRPRHQPKPKALHHRRVLRLAELPILHHQSILHSKRVLNLYLYNQSPRVLHHQDMLQLQARALRHPELLRPVKAMLHNRKVLDHRKDLHFPKVHLQELLQKQLRKRARWTGEVCFHFCGIFAREACESRPGTDNFIQFWVTCFKRIRIIPNQTSVCKWCPWSGLDQKVLPRPSLRHLEEPWSSKASWRHPVGQSATTGRPLVRAKDQAHHPGWEDHDFFSSLWSRFSDREKTQWLYKSRNGQWYLIYPNMILDSSLQRVWIARLRTSNKDNYASIAGRSRRRLRPSSALDGRPPPKARPGSDPGDLIRKMLSWTTKWPVAMKTDGKMLTDGVEASCSLCFEVMVVVAFGGTPFVQWK